MPRPPRKPQTPAQPGHAPTGPIPPKSHALEPKRVTGFRDPRVVHAGRLARIEHIHERLRTVRPDNTVKVTVTSLATELGRSFSTIFEDLRVMKESFGAPIHYDVVRGSQFYLLPPGAPPYQLRPRVWLDAQEALALMVGARRVFPFGDRIEAALTKLLPLVHGSVALDPATLEQVCSTPDNPATDADVENFVFLFHAILRRQEVQFVYSTLTQGAVPETRTVHPLHLVIFADSCVLVAHDPSCDDRRNFELTRLSEPQLTGGTFTPPAKFDLKDYLAGGMGPFLGEARHEVRLRFAPSYVAYVRKHPWHRPQLLVELPDGSAETTYRVAHTAIIEQRVLAAAGQVEVLSPPDLRTRIQTAARAVLARHA